MDITIRDLGECVHFMSLLEDSVLFDRLVEVMATRDEFVGICAFIDDDGARINVYGYMGSKLALVLDSTGVYISSKEYKHILVEAASLIVG